MRMLTDVSLDSVRELTFSPYTALVRLQWERHTGLEPGPPAQEGCGVVGPGPEEVQ